MLDAVIKDPASNPPVLRKEDAPVFPVKAATEVVAVKNEPASKPFVDRKLEAPVPEFESTPAMLLVDMKEPPSNPADKPAYPEVPELDKTPAMLEFVKNEPASKPPLLSRVSAAVPALEKTAPEPEAVWIDPAIVPIDETMLELPAAPIRLNNALLAALVTDTLTAPEEEDAAADPVPLRVNPVKEPAVDNARKAAP